jgi:hypothetical protein
VIYDAQAICGLALPGLCIYLAIVLGLFWRTEPIRVARRRDLSLGYLMFTTLQIDTELLDPLMLIRLGESGSRIGAR